MKSACKGRQAAKEDWMFTHRQGTPLVNYPVGSHTKGCTGAVRWLHVDYFKCQLQWLLQLQPLWQAAEKGKQEPGHWCQMDSSRFGLWLGQVVALEPRTSSLTLLHLIPPL